jgi:(p)ppGpp synthase/HD superfamily hydrolase
MSTELKPHMTLSDRFFTAVLYTSTIHREQTRKSTVIPYICHPLGAAASVIEAGGDEDQAIGALLHDVAEDGGGEPRLVEIAQMFGARVAAIVRGCSDSLAPTEGEKAPWRERKDAHLQHLYAAGDDVLIVTAADKLNNARAIATDLQTVGAKVWERFNTDRESILWYYNTMLKILTDRGVTPLLLNPLASAITIMEGPGESK